MTDEESKEVEKIIQGMIDSLDDDANGVDVITACLGMVIHCIDACFDKSISSKINTATTVINSLEMYRFKLSKKLSEECCPISKTE